MCTLPARPACRVSCLPTHHTPYQQVHYLPVCFPSEGPCTRAQGTFILSLLHQVPSHDRMPNLNVQLPLALYMLF